jgi:hypothetical protein
VISNLRMTKLMRRCRWLNMLYNVSFCIIWSCKRFEKGDETDEAKVDALRSKRDRAVDIFHKLAIRERSNAVETVKRQVSSRRVGSMPR